MKRAELIQFIDEEYGVEEEHPWMRYPDYSVFRHGTNRKWFALLMNLPSHCLGLTGNREMDVLNVKCDPALIGSLLQERGFYPAYHMNKTNWISIALEECTEDERIKNLVKLSFDMTDRKKKSRKSVSGERKADEKES